MSTLQNTVCQRVSEPQLTISGLHSGGKNSNVGVPRLWNPPSPPGSSTIGNAYTTSFSPTACAQDTWPRLSLAAALGFSEQHRYAQGKAKDNKPSTAHWSSHTHPYKDAEPRGHASHFKHLHNLLWAEFRNVPPPFSNQIWCRLKASDKKTHLFWVLWEGLFTSSAVRHLHLTGNAQIIGHFLGTGIVWFDCIRPHLFFMEHCSAQLQEWFLLFNYSSRCFRNTLSRDSEVKQRKYLEG